MHLLRLGKWTLLAAAAALGAAALAQGEGDRVTTTDPYQQVIGTATIDAVSSGKTFDIRGVAVQREGNKVTLTLVRAADQGTVALMVGVSAGTQMKVSIKLSSTAATYSFIGLHPISDSVGMLGSVNGVGLEQVVFTR